MEAELCRVFKIFTKKLERTKLVFICIQPPPGQSDVESPFGAITAASNLEYVFLLCTSGEEIFFPPFLSCMRAQAHPN